MLKKGFVQVYTGNGKGKTTAALGLSLRAAAHGNKVFIGQFLKGVEYGELQITEFTNGLVDIEQFGTPSLVHKISDKDVELAQNGLEVCKDKISSLNYSVVILDEINVAVYFKLIKEDDVISLIKGKPDNVELVLTGRYASKGIIDIADLVTEMKEIKHYYSEGIEAREGIEK
jgi:cob(I)alamin adenosyltransferase